MSSIEPLIAQIHASGRRLVLAVAGGGSRAIVEMLEVPGASRSVLQAVVPYSDAAMIEWLGGRPDHFCSEPTARAMAMRAFLQAIRLEPEAEHLVGVACTASLASDRPKRGPHRAHVAVQTATRTAVQSLQLQKGRRTRAEEERVVSELLLVAMAEACGVAKQLPLPLLAEEQVEAAEQTAPQSWRDLLLGQRKAVREGASAGKERPAAIFPGAFHPLHHGHRRMMEVAAEILGIPVEPEISIFNVDKPPLDYLEIGRRLGQFTVGQAVWLTRAATFDEKARLFPGATFLLGVDTLRRIADCRYYGNDLEACRAAVARIAERGCRFLVFGRAEQDRFVTLADLDLPEALRAISNEISAERFRHDISSTQLRRGNGEN